MRLLALIGSILVCNIIFAQGYYELIDSADNFIKKEDFAKAETAILQALKTEPANLNNSLLLSNLATLQRNEGRNSEALNNYSLALQMTPNATVLLSNRATLYLEMDSISQAYKDFEKIMSLDSKDIDSRYNHGMITLIAGDMVTSKADFDEILKIDSKSYEGKSGLALWYKHNKNYEEAIKLYSELIKKYTSSTLLTNRAECYIWRKQLALASDDLNSALKINFRDGYAYLLKAKLNKLRFQNDEIKQNVELAIKYGVEPKVIDELLK